MEKKISILGGDTRIVNLAKMMEEDGWEIHTYALEKSEELNAIASIHACDSLQEMAQKTEIIVTSIPLSKDGVYVNTPFSDGKVTIEEVRKVSQGKKFISGKLDENFQKDETIESYDILEIEEYAIFNAIATAEGDRKSVV